MKKTAPLVLMLLTGVLAAPNSYANANTYINDGNDYKAELAVKNTFLTLPKDVRNMIDETYFYDKQDGILGSSLHDMIHINLAYISSNPGTAELKHIKKLYRHEAGHIVDFNSFTSNFKSGNLAGDVEQGRYHYVTGSPLIKNTADGFRTKNAIKIKPGANYAVKSKKPYSVIALLFDKNMHVTRYASTSDLIVKTTKDEQYMHIYSVDKRVTLSDLSVREADELRSFSREPEFYAIYKNAGLNTSRYMTDLHEAFAEFFAYYECYKYRDISLDELKQKKLAHIIPYMREIEKSGYKL